MPFVDIFYLSSLLDFINVYFAMISCVPARSLLSMTCSLKTYPLTLLSSAPDSLSIPSSTQPAHFTLSIASITLRIAQNFT